jgi:hypothetical protein
MGANNEQAVIALREAEAYKGLVYPGLFGASHMGPICVTA